MSLASNTCITAAVNAINTAALAGFASLHTATTSTTGASENAATGGYARQSAAWSTSSGGSNSTNTGALTWTTLGTVAVSYFGTWSLVSGGNFNIGGALTSSVTAATITAAAGALALSAS